MKPTPREATSPRVASKAARLLNELKAFKFPSKGFVYIQDCNKPRTARLVTTIGDLKVIAASNLTNARRSWRRIAPRFC